jgi:protein transport protein SEC20
MAGKHYLGTLSQKLDTLTESYKQTLQNIHKIPRTPDPDELADLTSTIRDSLNSLDEDLDLLNLSIEDIGGARPDSEESQQKLRLSVQAQRLNEDLKNARQAFRRTQIYVKKAEDTARRKERDERLRLLREPPRVATPTDDGTTSLSNSQTLLRPPSRKSNRKAEQTEDDLLVSASSDVLAALRQTHALMATEVERSHFAAEILSNSSRELEQLGESYTDLDSMLKTSKGLVTQLMKSNKSDTWYLLSARTLLMVVAAWLVWRRLLWGPTWWLVWLPLKMLYLSMMMITRPLIGLGSGSAIEEPGVDLGGRSMQVMSSGSVVPGIVGDGKAPVVQVGQDDAQDPSQDGSLSQKIGRLAGKIVRGDGAELEESDEPRNPKKRFMDTSKDGPGAAPLIDELEVEQQQDDEWQDARETFADNSVRDEL